MRAAWTSFAADGDPGWPAYDTDRRLVQRFDTPSAVTAYPGAGLPPDLARPHLPGPPADRLTAGVLLPTGSRVPEGSPGRDPTLTGSTAIGDCLFVVRTPGLANGQAPSGSRSSAMSRIGEEWVSPPTER